MDYTKINLTKPEKWNRKFINTFWLISLIYCLGQFAVLIAIYICKPEGVSTDDYIHRHIIIPNIILLTLLLAIEFSFRYFKKYQNNIVLISSILICYALILTISPKLHGSQMILTLPIFVSVFYFNRKTMVYTSVITMVSYIAYYLVSPYQRAYTNIYELILIILVLIGASTAGVAILSRGIELIKSIEELAKSEEKLLIENSVMDKLSKTDALTGLYNHKTFHEFIVSVIEQCNSYNLSLQLAILDIDNFKQVNDTFGHHVGDIVLKRIAGIIKENVTPDDFVSRYGGEEFTIIFTGKSLDQVLPIIEKIREEVEATTFHELNDRSVTISIGLHDYTVGEGKESLFKHADGCLYSAKRTGKNKIVCS